MKNSQLAILCCAVVGGSLIVAGTNIWLVRSLRPADIVPASTRGEVRQAAGDRHDAEGEGRPLLHQLQGGRGRSCQGIGRGPDLGRTHGTRRGQAERGGGGLDHARGGCHRGIGGELRGDFDGAAQGARARHQGGDVGCRCGGRCARLLHQSGDAGRHRQHAGGRRRAAAGRQGRVRDRHGHAERGQSESVDGVHARSAWRRSIRN